MSQTVHSTDQVRRLFYKPAEAVFAALSQADKLRAWYGRGGGSQLEQFDLKFEVGGSQRAVYRMAPGSPVAGMTLVNDERFLQIVPNRRVVLSSLMSMEGNPFSASLVTFEIADSGPGTELVITHQDAFFENADGPEMRRDGWKRLLERIAEVIEAPEGAAVDR